MNKELEMTDGEICQMYRQARRKKQQIGILADLNLTSRSEIIKVLERNGVVVGNSYKTKATEEKFKTRIHEMNEEQLTELYADLKKKMRYVCEQLEAIGGATA